MELIIGGAHQGKLDWYHREYGTDAAVAQGETVSLQTPPQQPVLNHLHLWVRRICLLYTSLPLGCLHQHRWGAHLL